MEELKNIVKSASCEERKPYVPPKAEIVLLAPQEKLAAVDFKFHQNQDSYRWNIGGWMDFMDSDGLNDPSSGVVGTKTNAWALPTE